MAIPQKARFIIKRHATRPPLRLAATQADGSAFPFTGATGVTFVMKDESDIVVLSSPAEFETDETTGILRYNWEVADTSVEGEFQAEFDVAYPDGGALTLPLDGNITVRIYEDVNNA